MKIQRFRAKWLVTPTFRTSPVCSLVVGMDRGDWLRPGPPERARLERTLLRKGIVPAWLLPRLLPPHVFHCSPKLWAGAWSLPTLCSCPEARKATSSWCEFQPLGTRWEVFWMLTLVMVVGR